MPGVGKLGPSELQGASRTSCNTLRDLGPDIQWVHSYVADDKIFCLYQATDEGIIREHGRCGGFPVDAVYEVRATIYPATAELV